MANETANPVTTKMLAVCLFVSAFLFLNVDGYSPLAVLYSPLKFADWELFFAEPPASSYTDVNTQVQLALGATEPAIIGRSWMHGWPFWFAGRSPTYSISAGIGVEKGSMRGNDMAFTSRWPFDGAFVHYYSISPLILDILIGIMLAGAVWWSMPSGPVRFRFTILHALILTTVAAIFIRFKLLNFRFGPQVLALLVMAFCLVWIAAVTISRVGQKFRAQSN